MSPFPLIKLATLAMKQMSKPLAVFFKERAKTSPIFRKYICLPPAQLYHIYETKLKMKILGLGSTKSVAKLNEETAAELGAELLGETIVFMVGVFCLAFEYRRQGNKEKAKECHQEEKFYDLGKSVNILTIQLEDQDAKIRELNRELAKPKKS